MGSPSNGSAIGLASLGPQPEIEDLFVQIAESEAFYRAPVMRALLLYLWRHRGQPLSEYAIAVDVLKRSSDFDPKTDATVRVQVSRLRAKLDDFYEGEGLAIPLKLRVPLGGHELEWVCEAPQSAPPATLKTVPKGYWGALVGLAALALVFGSLSIVLLLQNRSMKAAMLAAPAPLPRLWQSFLASGKSTIIVVPSPVHFAWPDHNVYLRDLMVSEFSDWQSSPFVRGFAEKLGPPTLLQPYVGALDMSAGIKLLQYLQKHAQAVELIESRNFEADSYRGKDSIFVGLPRNTGYLKPMLERTNFYLAGATTTSPAIVRTRSPRAGEPTEYRRMQYGVDRRTDPGIVVLTPASPEGTRSLLLIGANPSTLTSVLVARDGLKLLDEQWVKAGSPDGWEAVVQAEIFRNKVLRAWPVALRPLPATFWK